MYMIKPIFKGLQSSMVVDVWEITGRCHILKLNRAPLFRDVIRVVVPLRPLHMGGSTQFSDCAAQLLCELGGVDTLLLLSLGDEDYSKGDRPRCLLSMGFFNTINVLRR